MIYRHQELYADTAAEIALRENIPLIPVRQTFLRNHRLSQLIAADGIHLTMPGYEQLFDHPGGLGKAQYLIELPWKGTVYHDSDLCGLRGQSVPRTAGAIQHPPAAYGLDH